MLNYYAKMAFFNDYNKEQFITNYTNKTNFTNLGKVYRSISLWVYKLEIHRPIDL